MSRQRSQCVIRKTDSIKNTQPEVDIEKITIEDKFIKDKKVIQRNSLKSVHDVLALNIKKPVFTDCKKEFSSKNTKVSYILID